MNTKIFEEMCHGLQTLVSQDNATRTIHRLLFGLKKTLDADCSILILKDPDSDYLKIKNYVNLLGKCARNFARPVGNGLLGKLFYTTDFVAVSRNASKEDYSELKLDNDYELVVAARVAVDNQSIGILTLYFDYFFDITQSIKNCILAAAGMISEAIRKERLLFLVNQLRRIDCETGLLCHDFFMHRLEEEVHKVERYRIPISLGIMDIDNFKEITNLYGLGVGKQLFLEVAEELKFSVRGVDVIGLFGADEYILYLPSTELESARAVLQRFRKKVNSKKFTEKEVETSLSIGLTAFGEKDSLKDLVWRAQTALYNAKLTKNGALKVLQ